MIKEIFFFELRTQGPRAGSRCRTKRFQSSQPGSYTATSPTNPGLSRLPLVRGFLRVGFGPSLGFKPFWCSWAHVTNTSSTMLVSKAVSSSNPGRAIMRGAPWAVPHLEFLLAETFLIKAIPRCGEQGPSGSCVQRTSLRQALTRAPDVG